MGSTRSSFLVFTYSLLPLLLTHPRPLAASLQPPPPTEDPLREHPLTLADDSAAQESANFFTSDLGAPFDSPSDYHLFDNFPSLPYFPEFGDIFRVARTTTPEPPFRFPDYREAFEDAFPEREPQPPTAAVPDAPSGKKYGKEKGRRGPRRPFRPASSGTRAKVSKQGHREQRPSKLKVVKSRPPGKSKEYPKIFRFTSDRVNLADFDMRKKMNENYLTLAKGDELDSNKIQRNKFLILHGGVFEIDRGGGRNQDLYPSTSAVRPDAAAPE